MASRLELHEILCKILGSRNVYFQPPESLILQYPAIVYKRNKIDNLFADNTVYMQSNNYEVTVIDYDPDSKITKKISQMERCRHDRNYIANNLNHDRFIINY